MTPNGKTLDGVDSFGNNCARMNPRTVRSYLEANPGETERALARRAGITQGTVNRLRRRVPGFRVSLEVAVLLESVTGGSIDAAALPLTARGRRALRAIRPGKVAS